MCLWLHDLAVDADVYSSAEPGASMWGVLIRAIQRRRIHLGEVMFLERASLQIVTRSLLTGNHPGVTGSRA